jgi:hypothetical protein
LNILLLALSEILHPSIHERTDDRKIISKLLELVFTFLINQECRFLTTIL